VVVVSEVPMGGVDACMSALCLASPTPDDLACV